VGAGVVGSLVHGWVLPEWIVSFVVVVVGVVAVVVVVAPGLTSSS
jgi:hypothetical protein